jgi:hypothetical protein
MKLLGLFLPPWVLPALGAVALAGAFWGGWQVQGWRCAARQTEALQQAQKRFERQLARQNEEAEQYEQEREQGRADARERENTVREIYRDIVVPGECAPDPDAVGLLEDAIRAANADPAEPGE